jgi:acyl-CoA synthetase (AMP-forming)/AMP-acid ligase II
MGPGYFVIAILGCADGGSACTPVTTLQTQYATEEQCSAATPGALEANSNFDFPTLVARCRASKPTASAEAGRQKPRARRG